MMHAEDITISWLNAMQVAANVVETERGKINSIEMLPVFRLSGSTMPKKQLTTGCLNETMEIPRFSCFNSRKL